MEGDNKMNENRFFCRNSERHGGDYMEFGFCRRSNMKNVFSNVTNWSDDSLYVDTDLLDEFMAEYGKYLEPCTSPDGSGRFCFYGLNYYSTDRAAEILEMVKSEKPRQYNIISKWLEKDIQMYNGFYILGV